MQKGRGAPAIAIEQKVNTRNPRSTVATTTEIFDYLRIIFARIGRTYSPVSGREVKCHSANDVMESILSGDCRTVYILADLGWDGREDKVELMLRLKEEGYSRFFGNDGMVRIEEIMKLAEGGEYPEGLMLLVDRVKMPEAGESTKEEWDDLLTRLRNSVDTAFREGNGNLVLKKDDVTEEYSNKFEMDGITFREPDEYLFSFNSPLGACPECGGLGKIIGISEDLVVPDKSLSIYDGAIACWKGEKMGWFKDHLVRVADRYGIRIFEPYCNLTEEEKAVIWDGHSVEGDEDSIIGINEFFKWVESNRYKIQYKYMLSRFSGRTTCHSCHGTRLRKEALYVKVGGRSIAELLDMDVDSLLDFFTNLKLSKYDRDIAGKAVEEIVSRLRYIQDVGLSYLTLSRPCNTLSGGESQRINLVTALGSSLVGSLYILDEPSIGLHPRDTDRLISVLRNLRDIGNTVVVVEHDEEIIRAADMLIDMGPKAGVDGGRIVFQGSIGSGNQDGTESLTLQYLSGERQRYVRQKRSWTYSITVEGAMEHNLKDIDVKFPLGVLTAVSGVSGSGKSSLVGDDTVLDYAEVKALAVGNPLVKERVEAANELMRYQVLQHKLTESRLQLEKELLEIPSKINGYTPSYFSFNQDGGRCPECQGDGFVRIPMQFMADVTMVCEACGGKRFKPDILEVRYKGKNIDDILNMSVEEAIAFFGAQEDNLARQVAHRLQPLVDVGLSYIKLGQSSSTLSGGESQRIKLAYFLALSEESDSVRRERILFLFDEPTTGLHFYDVEKLLKAFDVLLSKGHTVIVVEHNLDVIKAADWVIDLGPEAGDAGGEVVFSGRPEDLIAEGSTYTAEYLRKVGN